MEEYNQDYNYNGIIIPSSIIDKIIRSSNNKIIELCLLFPYIVV